MPRPTVASIAKTSLSLLLSIGASGMVSAQDTIRVTRQNPAWGAGASIRPLFTIGQAPEYIAGFTWAVAVDRANRFWLYDYREKSLKRFSADGKFLGRAGQSGAGPGEFRELNGINIIRDSWSGGTSLSRG